MEKQEIVDLKSIGERLRFIRKSKDITQKQMVALLGCGITAYNRYENGHMKMDIATLIKIHDVLDCSMDFLLFGKDIHTDRMQKLLTVKDNTTFKVNNSGGRLNVTISVPVLPELEGL